MLREYYKWEARDTFSKLNGKIEKILSVEGLN
jgi:hypothetical protein